ncbi:MAG: hypothetical protein IJ566_08560 [Cardiobacteriaceae bacterium]|nr:hypothetical protein [Cardiobacteriaceae bacterium]
MGNLLPTRFFVPIQNNTSLSSPIRIGYTVFKFAALSILNWNNYKNSNNHHFRVGNKLPTLRLKMTIAVRFFAVLKMTEEAEIGGKDKKSAV